MDVFFARSSTEYSWATCIEKSRALLEYNQMFDHDPRASNNIVHSYYSTHAFANLLAAVGTLFDALRTRTDVLRPLEERH